MGDKAVPAWKQKLYAQAIYKNNELLAERTSAPERTSQASDKAPTAAATAPPAPAKARSSKQQQTRRRRQAGDAGDGDEDGDELVNAEVDDDDDGVAEGEARDAFDEEPPWEATSKRGKRAPAAGKAAAGAAAASGGKTNGRCVLPYVSLVPRGRPTVACAHVGRRVA